MRKVFGLAIFAGLIAGCHSDPNAYSVGPSLNPPIYAAGNSNDPKLLRITGDPGPNQNSPQPKPPVGSVPRNWVPQAQLRDWEYIVVHHSDTDVGCATSFDRAHKQRGWECLGYDFVIGNGTQSKDGEIEVGQRWTKQMVGAHAGVLLYNDKGIGICLVGNFQETRPTSAQMQSLAKLTAYLMKTYRISPSHVIGHRDAKKGGTLCPGKNMDLNVVRRMASQYALLESPNNPAFELFAYNDDASKAYADSYDQWSFDESQRVDVPPDAPLIEQ